MKNIGANQIWTTLILFSFCLESLSVCLPLFEVSVCMGAFVSHFVFIFSVQLKKGSHSREEQQTKVLASTKWYILHQFSISGKYPRASNIENSFCNDKHTHTHKHVQRSISKMINSKRALEFWRRTRRNGVASVTNASEWTILWKSGVQNEMVTTFAFCSLFFALPLCHTHSP